MPWPMDFSGLAAGGLAVMAVWFGLLVLAVYWLIFPIVVSRAVREVRKEIKKTNHLLEELIRLRPAAPPDASTHLALMIREQQRTNQLLEWVGSNQPQSAAPDARLEDEEERPPELPSP